MPLSFHTISLGYILFIIVLNLVSFEWEVECCCFVTLNIIFVSKKGKSCITFNLQFCCASPKCIQVI